MSHAALCWTLAGMLPVAYLLGGVPFGLLVGRMRGVDVRTLGSGNIGATNVGRALGKRYFFFVLALDALKGALPTAIASTLVHTSTEDSQLTSLVYALWLGTGVAAMLGHIFSPFLKFKGGKGVSTGLGLTLGFFPYLTLPGLVSTAIFVVFTRITRYVSAGSIAGAASFPIAYLVFASWLRWSPLGRQWPITAMVVLMAALIIFRHRGNIVRLWLGTEIRNT